ncbi:hypothetical protein [Merismopedia glauca]|uniref:Uncharacterized protein n=1 Tax=Merismopedia glauca CCAP 1448/3 TaxID=1296344 RepID=A0A2T1C5V3_9CYAN|nr:hypothetical protein [Merismopedia glauca]PSB03650.1 hypothetical protein C7B64_07395 [Merismopedia glauca CCAP 1448/3]
MTEQLTDLDIAIQLEQLWTKINEGITLGNTVLEKGKLLDKQITQKQQEAIADLESRHQEVLKIQSSLADFHREFLELGELKQTLRSTIKDVNQADYLSNFIADFSNIRDEVASTRANCDRLQTKLVELELLLANNRENLHSKPAIADKVLQEQTLLINELKDFYYHAFSNLKRIENQTLETFNQIIIKNEEQSLYIKGLVAEQEKIFQANQELKTELETRFQQVTSAYQQIQESLTQVNSELVVQGMKQVEQIHLHEQSAKEQLSKFSENLIKTLDSSSPKESLQKEIEEAKKAIAQLIFQRQELQREITSSAEVVKQLTQTKIDTEKPSLNPNNSRLSEPDELRNKLKLIEQKYERLHQSVWWLSVGISIVLGIAIAFGKFIFK